MDGTDFVPHSLCDPRITLDQVLKLSGSSPASEYDVYVFSKAGNFIRLRECEQIDLTETGAEKFVVFRTDRANRLLIDEQRYDWGARLISGRAVRDISGVDDDELELWLERYDQPDELVADGDFINLEKDGVERFYFRKATWRIIVRRDTLVFDKPCVTAREVLEKAGFDLEKSWDLVIVTAAGRKNIGIHDTIDLRQPGIEKLRVKPKNINNGEKTLNLDREFSLLPKDHQFLEVSCYRWRTIAQGAKRWLIVENYPLPEGYSADSVSVALDVPISYPVEQIDMFYVYPRVTLRSGSAIPQVATSLAIVGKLYQRWSRHRPNRDDWNPEVDCIETHFELVEESLMREVS
jgi:hypothetical protein